MTKAFRVLCILSALCVLLTAASCADMGAGEGEADFYNYFSKVYLISSSGMKKKDIENFNQGISMENSDEIEQVVDALPYSYIAFKVADGYTLEIDEFAFFFKGAPTSQKEPALILDFFISNSIPSRILSESDSYVYLPEPESGDAELGTMQVDEIYIHETDTQGAVETRPNEVDENVFADTGYDQEIVAVTESWESAHLEFDTPQTVTEGQYIVIRIRNNCVIKDSNKANAGLPDWFELQKAQDEVEFTFNYLMFRFTSAVKK